ncbi:hypothetical protein LY41_003508 [Prauserella halophila]|nr:hypothetical protein [Prauserella halophila]
MPDWFWFVLSPLMLVVYLYYTWKQEQQTRDSCQAAANRLGWKYAKYGDGLANCYSGPLSNGVDGKI